MKRKGRNNPKLPHRRNQQSTNTGDMMHGGSLSEQAIALRHCTEIRADTQAEWISSLLTLSVQHDPFRNVAAKRVSGECLRLLHQWVDRFTFAGTGTDDYDDVVEDGEQIIEGNEELGIADAGGCEQLVPIRDDMVESAEAFLNNDKVQDKTVEEKLDFLISQGVRTGEIKLACKNQGLRDWDTLLNVVARTQRMHVNPDDGVSESEDERIVREAAEFLYHPSVQDRTLKERIDFLRTKMSISDELLQVALKKGSAGATVELPQSDLARPKGKSHTPSSRLLNSVSPESEPQSRKQVTPKSGPSKLLDDRKQVKTSESESSKVSPEVQKAMNFLKHPSVTGKPLSQVLPFLTSKGMKRSDVEEAYKLLEMTGSKNPIRTPQVEKALQFLKHPSVTGKSMEQIIPFLTTKGLAKSDIETAKEILDSEENQEPRDSLIQQGFKFLTHPKVNVGKGDISLAKARTYLIQKGLTIAEYELALNRAKSGDDVSGSENLKAESSNATSKHVTLNKTAGFSHVALQQTSGTDALHNLSPRLQQAVRFLRTPEVVSTTPISERVLFLKAQGLPDAEIAEAWNIVDRAPSGATQVSDTLGVTIDAVVNFVKYLLEQSPSLNDHGELYLSCLSEVHDPTLFVPCSKWRGPRNNRVFKLGSLGLGYYPDDGIPELGRPFHLAVHCLIILLRAVRFSPWSKTHPGTIMELLEFLQSDNVRNWDAFRVALCRDPVLSFPSYSQSQQLHRHRNALIGKEANDLEVLVDYLDCEELIATVAEYEACGQEIVEYVKSCTLVCSINSFADGRGLTFTPTIVGEVFEPGRLFSGTLALVRQFPMTLQSSFQPLNWEHGLMIARSFHSRFAPIFAALETFKWEIDLKCSAGLAQCDEGNDVYELCAASFLIAGVLSGKSQYPRRLDSSEMGTKIHDTLIRSLFLAQKKFQDAKPVLPQYGFSKSSVLVAIGASCIYANLVGQVNLLDNTDEYEERAHSEIMAICEVVCGGSLYCPAMYSSDEELTDNLHVQFDECIRFTQTTLFQMKTQLVAVLANRIEEVKGKLGNMETSIKWIASRFVVHAECIFRSQSNLLQSQVAKELVLKMETEKPQTQDANDDITPIPTQLVQIVQSSYLSIVVVGATVLANLENVEVPHSQSCVANIWNALGYCAAFAVPVREASAIESWMTLLCTFQLSSDKNSTNQDAIEHLVGGIAGNTQPKSESNGNVQLDDELAGNSQLKSESTGNVQLKCELTGKRIHFGSLDWIVDEMVKYTNDENGIAHETNWMLSARLEYMFRGCEEWMLQQLALLSATPVKETPVIVSRMTKLLLYALSFEQQSLNQTAHFWLTTIVAHIESGTSSFKVLHDTEDAKGNQTDWNEIPFRLAVVPAYCVATMKSHPRCTSTENFAFAFGSMSTSLGSDPCEAALALSLLLVRRVESKVVEMLSKQFDSNQELQVKDPIRGDELLMCTMLFTMLKAVSLQVMDAATDRVEEVLEWVKSKSDAAYAQLIVVLFGVIQRTRDIPRRTELATWYLENVQASVASRL